MGKRTNPKKNAFALSDLDNVNLYLRIAHIKHTTLVPSCSFFYASSKRHVRTRKQQILIKKITSSMFKKMRHCYDSTTTVFLKENSTQIHWARVYRYYLIESTICVWRA